MVERPGVAPSNGRPAGPGETQGGAGSPRDSLLRVSSYLPLLLVAFLLSGVAAQAQSFKTSVATFSTNSTTFTDVTGGSLTFTPGATTDVWIILISAGLSSTDTTAVAAEAQYLVNGVPRGMGGIQNNTASAGGSWQHFDFVTGTTLQQTVQVQLRDAQGPADTATIDDLQIVAFRLPAGADFQFAETMGVRLMPGDGAWASYRDLDVTPASDGDYLIMAVANAHESPGSQNPGLRVRDPAASFWPIDDGGGHWRNPRNTWNSFFVARVESLLARGTSPAFGLSPVSP